MVKMAKPIAASAAAIVKTKITKISPIASSKYIDAVIKFMLTERSINSKHIRVPSILFLFKTTPNTLIVNNNTFSETIPSILNTI